MVFLVLGVDGVCSGMLEGSWRVLLDFVVSVWRLVLLILVV